ncbi:hypothetical protein ACIQVT_01010 [Streptomyces sp. NPDC100445]
MAQLTHWGSEIYVGESFSGTDVETGLTGREGAAGDEPFFFTVL